MKSKKLIIFMILFSMILILSAAWLMLSGKADDSITGILFGIGSGLFGVGIACIFENYFYKNNPKLYEKKIIEQNDERNISINNKAKAKSGTLIMYLNFILAMVMSVLHIEVWAVLSVLLIGLLYPLLTSFLIVKYNNQD